MAGHGGHGHKDKQRSGDDMPQGSVVHDEPRRHLCHGGDPAHKRPRGGQLRHRGQHKGCTSHGNARNRSRMGMTERA